MSRAYYSSSIETFINEDTKSILGELFNNSEFEVTDQQRGAWRDEIEILKDQLQANTKGDIAFEFTIPRMGHRVDVVIIISGIVFLLEFKVGDDRYRKSTKDQVMDYALDLKYFHEASSDKYIIPIIVATEAKSVSTEISIMDDKITNVFSCNKTNVGKVIANVLDKLPHNKMKMNDWINARYAPVPTIIEAVQALYRNHSVKDITRKDARDEDLDATKDAISSIVENCKKERKKAICFVTGVPGAGKTLAGLDIANSRHQFDEDEHAVFLSGNGPLVDVLQKALARDKKRRDGGTMADAERDTKAFIQNIHKFRDEALTTNKPPIEKVTIFDEAQRAWDKNALSKFMNNKKGISNFNQSEPEFLISIMNRHKDWATIICLVGGGQEIYKGEAGIASWFKALKQKYTDWGIYLSDKMTEYEYVGDSKIQDILDGRQYEIVSSLHLNAPLRQFRSESISNFVKAFEYSCGMVPPFQNAGYRRSRKVVPGFRLFA